MEKRVSDRNRWFSFLLFIALVSLLFSSDGLLANQPQRPPKLVLTNQINGLEPANEFTCSETIHGYLTLPDKAIGSHTLEGIWVMPNGIEKEHSKNQLEFSAPGRQTAYVWLQFQDKSGGLLGDVRSSGKDDSNEPHNGQWQVKVLWDGQLLIETKFKVKC